MKISELVALLEKTKEAEGDLVVVYPEFMTDGCGAGEVMSMVVSKAKTPKGRGRIYLWSHGAYSSKRSMGTDTKVLVLRDNQYSGGIR